MNTPKPTPNSQTQAAAAPNSPHLTRHPRSATPMIVASAPGSYSRSSCSHSAVRRWCSRKIRLRAVEEKTTSRNNTKSRICQRSAEPTAAEAASIIAAGLPGIRRCREIKAATRPSGANGVITDLGTLGGLNSSMVWPVKNNNGIIVGISQTANPEPNGERWSSAAFYGGPNNVGFIHLGFVWERGQMRGLPTLGGNNGFASGANNRGEAVGWAENATRDATCVAPQVLQFRPVLWDLKRGDEIHEFPLIAGDTSGAATSINNRGQAVGISGICDQALGRHTAKHAVLWDKGNAVDIRDFGADWWNTPTAINERGDIVGFMGDPGSQKATSCMASSGRSRKGRARLALCRGMPTARPTASTNAGRRSVCRAMRTSRIAVRSSGKTASCAT